MNNTDLPGWISAVIAVGAAGVGVVMALLKSIFVTRSELRKHIERMEGINDTRHSDNVKRFTGQDAVLAEIRENVAHIAGEMSGRYKRPGT